MPELQFIAARRYFKRNYFAEDNLWSITVEVDELSEKAVGDAFGYVLANHPEEYHEPTHYKVYGLNPDKPSVSRIVEVPS